MKGQKNTFYCTFPRVLLVFISIKIQPFLPTYNTSYFFLVEDKRHYFFYNFKPYLNLKGKPATYGYVPRVTSPHFGQYSSPHSS